MKALKETSLSLLLQLVARVEGDNGDWSALGQELWCLGRPEPQGGGGRLHLQSLLALGGGICLTWGFPVVLRKDAGWLLHVVGSEAFVWG